MGQLIDGAWSNDWYDTKTTGGRFVRGETQFRSWVTADGASGPSGQGGFAAEKGRYHLYVSLACPWAHRALIFRVLKGLEEHISMSVVHYLMGAEGWTFADGPGVIADSVQGCELMHQVYTNADPRYTGRVTVPVLWDKKTGTIVNNESSEIIRMLNAAFDHLGAREGDYYPETLRDEIDAINERVYDTLNNGVYRCGFATSQEAYEEAFRDLFETMDWLEGRLSTRRYLLGDTLTEADWRLFPTLVRFDPVYVGHFKTNLRRLIDYPNLFAYTRELYQIEGIKETVDLLHIKRHYYQSHPSINPTGIVPLGPEIDYDAPHGRG